MEIQIAVVVALVVIVVAIVVVVVDSDHDSVVNSGDDAWVVTVAAETSMDIACMMIDGRMECLVDVETGFVVEWEAIVECAAVVAATVVERVDWHDDAVDRVVEVVVMMECDDGDDASDETWMVGFDVDLDGDSDTVVMLVVVVAAAVGDGDDCDEELGDVDDQHNGDVVVVVVALH